MEKTRQYGFGPEVKRRIMLGTYALSAGYYDAYYKQAEKVRTLITRDFEQAFERFDVLASPANLAGICGVSIPGGFSEGLPVGLQLLGPAFGEAAILQVADAFEHVTDFHTRWPRLE